MSEQGSKRGPRANKPFHGPEKKLSKKLKRKEVAGEKVDTPLPVARTYQGGRAKGKEVSAPDAPPAGPSFPFP
jgi:hypothetical protein